MTAYDFKLDEDGDLYIDPVTKDLVLVPSDRQHIKDILLAAPGHYKEFPLVGWNPYKRLNARGNKLEMNQSAKIQLQGDGFTVREIDIDIDPAGEVTLKKLNLYR